MGSNTHRIGWIGIGRMGFPMAERLLKAGHEVHVWNRTRAKAEPLAAKGAILTDRPADLGDMDILFTMVSTAADVEQVLFGADGVVNGSAAPVPRIIVDCSSIGADQSAAIRARLDKCGAAFLASPVSGNGKTVKAGKLSAVVSGPRDAFDVVKPYLEAVAGNGVAYVGEGELARFCKLAHNVLLGVVIQNLAEITVLAEKAGVPRHAFLEFINNSVIGLDLLPLQDAGARQSRLHHDLHAGAPSQGPRPRPRCGARARRFDAGHRRDARGAASAFRRRHAETGSRRLS